MAFVFPPAPTTSLPVIGTDAEYPVRRIYCVGRNYADHVVEMGGDPDRDAPFFFSKPSDAITLESTVPYPPKSDDFHHEMELVIAIGKTASKIKTEDALDYIFGYAAGVDLTRRDLQAWAKEHRRPWDMAKGFDKSAPLSAISPASSIGHPESGKIFLSVNGKTKQDGDLAQQVWKVPEIVAFLSNFVKLEPGDLIMTGTPAGVGPLKPGDKVFGEIEAIGTLEFEIGPQE